jgi:hypothetical protein
MFLTPGSIIEDGIVVFSPDGSHRGERLPEGWIVPPDAVPLDQQSYDAMSELYAPAVIVTHDPAIERSV